MTVYITKQSHYNYRYLLNWHNPETGSLMGSWFYNRKELEEYISKWVITKRIEIQGD